MAGRYLCVGTSKAKGVNYLPLVVAAVIGLSGRLVSANNPSSRFVSTICFVAGFFVGCLLQDMAVLLPHRHWQWVPYTTLAASVVAVWTSSFRLTLRLMAGLFVSTAIAWLLVPTWESLSPPRTVCALGLAGYLFCGTGALLRWSPRVKPTTLFVISLMTIVAISIIVSVEISITYGQMGVVAAVAWAATAWKLSREHDALNIAGVLPAFFVMATGVAWCAFIEPQPPLLPMSVLPLAPIIGLISAGKVTIPTEQDDEVERRIEVLPLLVTAIVLLVTVAYIAFTGSLSNPVDAGW